MKFHETALTELARIVEIIAIFLKILLLLLLKYGIETNLTKTNIFPTDQIAETSPSATQLSLLSYRYRTKEKS